MFLAKGSEWFAPVFLISIRDAKYGFACIHEREVYMSVWSNAIAKIFVYYLHVSKEIQNSRLTILALLLQTIRNVLIELLNTI